MEFTKLRDTSQLQPGRLSQTSRPNQLLQPIQSRTDNTKSTNSQGKTSIVKQDDPICTVEVTCGALNVRSEANASAPRIGGVTLGKVLNVYEVKDGWLKIGYGTQYGWVLAKYTTYKADDPIVTEPDPKPDPDPTTPVDPTEMGDTGEDYGTLKKGSSGEGVVVLQKYLNFYLQKYHNQPFGHSTFKPLETDGKFGSQTFRHLSYYQYSRNLQSGSGISVDGICGSNSWKALRGNAPQEYEITEPKSFEKFKCLGKYDGVPLSGGGTMRADGAAAYEKMYTAALNGPNHYELKTINAYRGMTDEESKRGSVDKNGKTHNSDGQIELFDNNNSDTGACAQPGNSKHQKGTAIDFSDMSTKDTAKFKWMYDNAGTYGFKNYDPEPWHWYYDP